MTKDMWKMFTILVMIDYRWVFFDRFETKEEAESEVAKWKAKYKDAIFRIVDGE